MSSKAAFSGSLSSFLKELGSSAPSPGGGSAAALTGAAVIALIEMVTRLNDKREIKKGLLRRPGPASSTLSKYRTSMLRTLSSDSAAFAALIRIKDRKSAAYQAALKKSASIPLGICDLCAAAVDHATPQISRTSRWLISDLIEAGILLEASFYSAKLNVEVNLSGVKDASFVKKTRVRMKKIQQKMTTVRKKLDAALVQP